MRNTAPVLKALAALLIVLAIGAAFPAEGAFFNLATHRDALRQASIYGILACGMTLVIISGGIDLAVGSLVALTAVVVSRLSIWMDWAPLAAIAATLLVGALLGATSGFLTAYVRLQPFIATLAMMVFARGLAKTVSGGVKVSTAIQEPDGTFRYAEVPAFFRTLDSRVFGEHIAVVALIFALVAGASWLLLSKHRWGRDLYAIGGNEEAARLAGIPVARSKLLAYAYCGALAAVAGICQAAQEQQGDPEAGAGYELAAIAAVVVGGTSLMGGRGGIGLTVVGILTIGYLEKILSINAVPEAMRLMFTGAIIVAAVMLQRGRNV